MIYWKIEYFLYNWLCALIHVTYVRSQTEIIFPLFLSGDFSPMIICMIVAQFLKNTIFEEINF